MNKNNFAELRDSALVFVAKEQDDEGKFTSITKTEKGDVLTHWTIFYPALIGSILIDLPDILDKRIILEKLTKFIENEKTVDFGYQYWSKSDDTIKTTPYPKDLDDTSLCMSFKSKDEKDFESIGDFVLLLTKQEHKPGGPYYTWVGNHQGAWGDTDPVVNSAVHFALQKYDVHLESLEIYLTNCLLDNTWESPYYASRWLNLYLISRSLNLNKQNIIYKIAKDLCDQNPPKNLLDEACKILIFNEYTDTVLENFSNNQFIAEPAINEITIPGNKEVSGSAALTAVLWAVVWHKAEVIYPEPELIYNQKYDHIRDSSTQIVAQKMNKLVPELRERGISTLANLLARPVSHEIIFLSNDIGSSLTTKISDELYSVLGAANIFGWLAFGMYDECYDEGIISPDLSLANICLRACTKQYEKAAEMLGVDPALIGGVLDTIDQAHAEELSDTIEFRNMLTNSVPWTGLTIRQISERSFGHCLGSLLISQSLGLDKEFYQNLKSLFNHYLTARQICDDLHDWPQDFSAKRITSITKPLFLASHAFPNTNQFQAKKIFWNEGLELAIKRAKQELSDSLHIFKKIHWPIKKPVLILESIYRLEKSLDKVTAERLAIKSLINQFKKYEQVHCVQ